MSDAIKILSEEVLSHFWAKVTRIKFLFRSKNGNDLEVTREVYDRGNGATILLYNKEKGTVLLTRQFRLPLYLSGDQEGMSVETCAGTMEKGEAPETTIVRETEEETCYRVSHVEPVYAAYMSPGSVTEKVHFYVAAYDASMKVSAGGGLASEQEEVTTLELSLDEAFAMIDSGEIIDGKTIMLLQYARLHHLTEKDAI